MAPVKLCSYPSVPTKSEKKHKGKHDLIKGSEMKIHHKLL